jgi:hypothetical protein
MAQTAKPRLLIMIAAAGAIAMISITAAQPPRPWDTPQGRACFERWIAESMAKLNAFNCNAEFNARKPWSLNKYGLLEGTPSPHSVHAPDDFPKHGNNKYWWMWDQWVPAGANGHWLYPERVGAKVESIGSFVLKCLG